MQIAHKEYKKNKILFFPGFLVSVMGSALFSFATGLYLLEATGRSFFYALNILLFTLPLIIFGPFLGNLTDKFCKKKLIIWGDFFNAILMISIYFLWDRVDKLILIYVGAFLSSTFATLVSLSFTTGVPKFFGKEWMVQANSLSQIINSLARIMGPFLGGLVYGLGNIKFFILFNGLSFLVSMIAELFLEIDPAKLEDSKEKNRIKDGINYLKKNKELKIFILKFTLINFAAIAAIVIPVPYIVNQVFGLGSKTLGMVQGSLPIGAIIGAIFVNRKKIALTEKAFIGNFSIFLIACLVSYSTSLNSTTNAMAPYVLALAMFISGIAFGILDVTATTYFQESIPENIRGKIVGIITGIVKCTMPLAFLISGKITDTYSPFLSIILGGTIIFLALIILCVVTYMRENEQNKISETV